MFTRRRPFSRTLEVTGSVPRTGRDYVRTVSTDNPTRGLLLAFRDALGRFGIAVSGDVADIDDVAAKPAGPRRLLHVHESPPLREIGIRLMKVSQNLIAETLRARIGLASDVPDVDPLAAASGAYERTLAAWGVPVEDVIVADGSGLSRYDYLTADALVDGAAPHGAGAAPRRRVRGDAADPGRRRHARAAGCAARAPRAASAPRPAACRTSARSPAT